MTLQTHTPPRKKAFSLIELIIVITVIAAISAVIVPSMSNFSGSADDSSDRQNILRWNRVYQNLYSMNESGETWIEAPDFESIKTITGSKGTVVPAISGKSTLASRDLTFSAPSFTLRSDLTLRFDSTTNSLVLE